LFYYKGFQFFTGSELDASICEGDSIFLESGWQTIAETYYDTLISHLGWDSIVNIHLEVLPILPNPIITEEFGNLNSTYANNYQWYLDGNPIAGAINQEYHPVINGSYQVATENNNNCLSFSEVYVFLNTGINKSLKNKYEIYPNPTSGKISIKNSNVKQVEIYNFRGVLVQSSNKREFDLGQETKGIYFVKFITKEGIFTEKIVLE
jgi:hypothetical protein